jgi:hypothetical protein
MMIPLTLRSNYLVDGVPSCGACRPPSIPRTAQFGLGSALTILAARSGLRHVNYPNEGAIRNACNPKAA